MSAPTVEAVTVAPQRRRIAVGKKIGRGPFVVEMSENDKQAHAAASHVRTQPAR
ncbi:hypothetical protein [Streptomyces zaomyceticus]|uniref:hypothetical protein n=1 Tax=Streptomyces zaomyceticus TaxID=68286 RepID=UPI002E0DB6D5|nr:hypothetical protein OG237_06465 [Streptomyces zaomyceticus]